MYACIFVDVTAGYNINAQAYAHGQIEAKR